MFSGVFGGGSLPELVLAFVGWVSEGWVLLAFIRSATLLGVDGRPVTVEVHIGNGLPGFTVVGLPDAAVREARDRVRAALLSSGLVWPQWRVKVNLAPSGVRKAGPGLDLSIAIGLLVASGQLDSGAVEQFGFAAELALDGSLRPLPGIVSLVGALGAEQVVVAPTVARQAELVTGPVVRSAGSLAEVVRALSGRIPWPAN